MSHEGSIPAQIPFWDTTPYYCYTTDITLILFYYYFNIIYIYIYYWIYVYIYISYDHILTQINIIQNHI